MKNKILLFFIFCSLYNPVWAEGAQQHIALEISSDDEINRLSRENTILELQMKNKFLKQELENAQKTQKGQTDEKKSEEPNIEDKEIKQLKKKIELLQSKYNFFIAKQANSEEFKRSKELDLKIELAKKELELKNFEQARDRVVEENKIEYREDPLLKDGTLVLSDRQIHIGKIINQETADEVLNDVDFYNNKNNKLPIFLIFDQCGGGEVLAGMQIVNKIKSSQAPVYVLVKGYVASMAAVITTLATKSFCFANSRILYHQPSRLEFLSKKNVRESEEDWIELKNIWERTMEPVAKKMGISLESFMKKMYEKNSHGDWKEFGTEAKKLHWVDEIIISVRDTSVKLKYQDQLKKDKNRTQNKAVGEKIDTLCYVQYPEQN